MVWKIQGVEGENYLESIKNFLNQLLKSKNVDAVLVPKRFPDGNNTAQVLITDPGKLDDIDPLAPVQMVNSAQIVKELTKDPVKEKIASVLRPCEVRATIELIKLKQILDARLYIIGYDCPGVYNVKDYIERLEKSNGIGKEGFTLSYVNGFLSGKEDTIRESCQLCTHFTGNSADINIAWVGSNSSDVFIEVNSEKGQSLIEGLAGEKIGDLIERNQKINKILDERKKRQENEIDDFLGVMQRCIRCYNCREVCPLCYCKECLLKPEKMGYSSDRYLRRATKKGQIKMPVDTVLYHLTKINHMAFSCVSCGLCEQACPMDIPLGRIYNVFGRKAQALFDYEPGRSLDDELPVTTFKEDELKEIEDVNK